MAGRFIYLPCMQCSAEAMDSGELLPHTIYKIFNHNNYDKHLFFICNKGHRNIIEVDELPFETLLHCAFDDFFNQYYRESVFNFAAAQERFFEFAIGLICSEAGIDYSDTKKAWKLVINQSERQLGAFCFLFFQRFKKIPFAEDIEKRATFRNSIVHKGNYPSQDDAKSYGEFVIENIHRVLTILLENIEPKIVLEFKFAKRKEAWDNRCCKDRGCLAGAFPASTGQSILSWQLASPEVLEQERRRQKYCAEHPEEYAQAADKANRTQKVLFVNDDGKLTLVTQKDFLKKAPNAKLQVKTFDEYVVATQQKKSHYIACERSTNPDLKIIDRTHE